MTNKRGEFFSNAFLDNNQNYIGLCQRSMLLLKVINITVTDVQEGIKKEIKVMNITVNDIE